MSSFDIDQISSVSSIDTFAPVAVYRLKYYEPESLFDNVLYALIRPPRFVYNQRLLIPGRRYQQKFDYQVHNIPFPLSIYWAQNPKYIIIYLHGNSSSRFEGYLHLRELPEGACLACFDFKGCGLRKDGKYITLGKQQSIEVDIAVQYLKTYGYPIIGWGRSMGAVSLLMSSKCQIMIADSPFCSLYDLCKETSLNFIPAGLCCLVHCFFPCLFCCVRSGVEKKSGMDPNDLETIKAVERQCPTKSLLLLAGKQDSMIHYSHAQRLHDVFRGKQKRLILFEGTHNSTRPEEVFQECFQFIDSCIEKRQSPKTKILKPLQYNSACKVFKIGKQTSGQSLINNATMKMSEHRQFESSNEALLAHMKTPIELMPLKINTIKSSPKKFSRIQGNMEIRQEVDIDFHHEQKIICQGIGKFEKNLCKPHQQSFRQISMKNQIQSSIKKPIQLKSIRPLNEKVSRQVNQGSKIQINVKNVEKPYQKPTISTQISYEGDKTQKYNEKHENSIKNEIKNENHANKKSDGKGKITLNSEQIIIKSSEIQLRQITSEMSHTSTLHYGDVILVQQKNVNTLKDDKFQNESLELKSKTTSKQDAQCKKTLLMKSTQPQQIRKTEKIETVSPSIKGLNLLANQNQLQCIDLQ